MKRKLFFCRTASSRATARLLESVRENFSVVPGPQCRCRRAYHDTFDWRLFRAGMTIEHDSSDEALIRCRSIGSRGSWLERHLQHPIEAGKSIPCQHLPGDIRALTGERAALARAVAEVRSRSYRVLDGEGKMHAVLYAEELWPLADEKTPVRSCWLRICTLRGYGRTGERLVSSFGASVLADDPFFDVVGFAGVQPGGYTLRPQLPSDTHAPAAAELARLLLRLLDVMELNVAGMRSDLDTEFLHDFRIACRRSRVLVSQMQGVFPAGRLRYFKDVFAWMSRQTSAQRDLDVFLAQLPGYQERLSSEHARALQPLRELLETRRGQAHASLRKALASPRFRRFRRSWRTFLRKCLKTAPDSPEAAPAIGDVANAALRRVFRQLLTQHAAIGGYSYSEALHELRKTGKKMRYLLESCGPLYAERDAGKLVRHLKQFQNDLGALVDFHVQLTGIQRWQSELAEMPDTGTAAIRALQALAGMLEAEESRAQQRFAGGFRDFAARSTVRQVEKMIGTRS